ncbi:MAG TPA: flavin reductase family protein [Sporichthyaceae bacterium]|jgi:flavin reductase (DIM6/NTAB) family NADH-FMN oxidoreductase RutF
MATVSPLDPRRFRAVMSRFATGVTVVTTPYDDGVHAMTANGFLSVSLEPPLVLVSLGQCRMAGLLPSTGRYGISVLAEDQRALSGHFAGRPDPTADPQFTAVDGLPFLAGAVAHIGCRVVDSHPAGDHTLFIGEVEHLAQFEARPLLFHSGGYSSLRVGLTDDFFWC